MFHFRHRFVPVRVDNMQERVAVVTRGPKTGEELGSKRVTDVYEKCTDCPKTRVREIDGIWELEDLINPSF